MTHLDAYPLFRNKRMGNKNPNGNIIVDQKGNYNLFDAGIHKKSFDKIKEYYIVGDKEHSKLLESSKIKNLSATFNDVLNKIFNLKSKSNFEIITRKGRVLNDSQVNFLLEWINKI